MRRYLALLIKFISISAVADLEYRLNMLLTIVSDFIWYLAQILVFEVIFFHIPNLAGWNIHTVRVLLAHLFLVDMFYMIFFASNIEGIKELVRTGEMDLLLTKPVNAQFMVSLRRTNTQYFINMPFLFGYLIWALHSIGINWERLPILILTLPAGTLIIYSLAFMMNTLTIIFHKADYVTYLWYQIYRFGYRPDNMYPPLLRVILLTLLPVAFIASVPAQLLVLNFSWILLIGTILLPLFFLGIASLFWRKALRYYTSASS